MLRVLLLVSLPLHFTAGTAEATALGSALETKHLPRAEGGEVRLRCGSEALRARLGRDKVVADAEDGKSRVLTPTNGPNGDSGTAYSDGKLTLYKMPGGEDWALANGSSAVIPCTREEADQGTGKSAIPAK